jgi:CRP-like cAMP-binding protein
MAKLKQKLEAFTHLSQADRAAVDRVTSLGVKEIPARRDLVREGDPPTAIYVVLEGWACRYKTLPDGRRQIVGLFVPGDLCDLHVFLLKEMDHNVGALTRLRVASIGSEEFQQLMDNYPRVNRALWWNELVTVAIQREWTLNIGQRSAYERIAHLMCEMYTRMKSVGLVDGESCTFPLTQSDIGDATGLTAVHVNRTIQDLRHDGLIELHSRRLVIRDLPRLKSAAMFTPNYLHLEREGAYLDAND